MADLGTKVGVFARFAKFCKEKLYLSVRKNVHIVCCFPILFL